MWTLIRFALEDDAHYPPAFELLARVGFRPHRAPGSGSREPVPAAALAHCAIDPATASRAVFEALLGAGLGPVCVIGGNVGELRLGLPLAPGRGPPENGNRSSPCRRAPTSNAAASRESPSTVTVSWSPAPSARPARS